MLLYFLCSSTVIAQEPLNFVQIEVKSGPSVYGMASIKLLREGLVCRAYTKHGDKLIEKIKFFPLDELDKDKFNKIQRYVTDKEIFLIDNVDVPDTVLTSFRNPIVIYYVQLQEDQFSMLEYRYCDPRVDAMLSLLNEVIPRRWRDLYSIAPICGGNG